MYGYFVKEHQCTGNTENSHFEKGVIASVTQADLGSNRSSKMEIFVAYHQHIRAYLGYPGLSQTSKMESFTKIVNN